MIVPAGLAFNNFVIIAIVVATLYFSREILVPIALSVCAGACGQAAPALASSALLGGNHCHHWIARHCRVSHHGYVQVNQLARDLPRYQVTLSEKVHSLRGILGPSGLFKDASSLLKDISKELEAPEQQPATSPSALTSAEYRQAHSRRSASAGARCVRNIRSSSSAAGRSFHHNGIVLIFVTFFLFQREDLRNRFIRLVGSGDIERTTTALDDAGRRLGKLFATQLILNAVFGFVIGSGLALIGVPSASLWGLLAMILRFVPYIGALLAAVLPLTLAAAVARTGRWSIWTRRSLSFVELVMGQVIEPFIYGRSAGLSPVAIVIAAAFWTWLWGPLGLLMSTPLTLCLVVLARHVDRSAVHRHHARRPAGVDAATGGLPADADR